MPDEMDASIKRTGVAPALGEGSDRIVFRLVAGSVRAPVPHGAWLTRTSNRMAGEKGVGDVAPTYGGERRITLALIRPTRATWLQIVASGAMIMR